MASIMPFPNVATHRRLPHLQNSHKEVAPQKIPQDGATTTTAATTTHIQHSRSQDQTDSPLQLTGPDTFKKNNLLLNDSKTPQGAKNLLQDSHSSSDSSSRSPQMASSSSSRSSTSPSLSSHDSKMIKTALYDAFGVLYHPSAHTKHSLSTAAAALRSGDVTPLMGVSPGGSPLLQPQPGTSAPITPLELSDESTVPGYFGLQISSPSTVSSSGTGAPSSHGLHPYSRHHQHHHTSSHLNQTFTPEQTSSSGHRSGFTSPLSLSRRSSVDQRAFDPSKDPEHHPVLSSLQSLSLTHPPQHYHPHLGHDLGHDKVSINPPEVAMEVKVVVKQPTPQEAQEEPKDTTAKALERVAPLPPKPSPFPMDQGDSISQFGNEQGLI
ncbi:hypothetical protein CPB97_012150 [Podila verticillata]|nr:hypothetical protein CPB97_012150 [Podila verticillata]